MSADIDSVEPFVERIGPAQTSAGAYRFGYRLERTKDILTSIVIQADAVEPILTAGMVISARMSPAGDVSPAIVRSEDTLVAPSFHLDARSIERLVADAVSPDNLKLEEASVAELEILLGRLNRAVALVAEALARPVR
jgi:hypothetical protein